MRTLVGHGADGVISLGGGMLASICLRPTNFVVNPETLQLKNPTIINVRIPSAVDPLKASDWITDLDNEGILQRGGSPRAGLAMLDVHPTHRQYLELFEYCADAAVLLKSEAFYFLPPLSTSPI